MDICVQGFNMIQENGILQFGRGVAEKVIESFKLKVYKVRELRILLCICVFGDILFQNSNAISNYVDRRFSLREAVASVCSNCSVVTFVTMSPRISTFYAKVKASCVCKGLRMATAPVLRTVWTLVG